MFETRHSRRKTFQFFSFKRINFALRNCVHACSVLKTKEVYKKTDSVRATYFLTNEGKTVGKPF